MVYICKFMIVICFTSNNIPSTGIYKGCTFPSISLRTSPLDFTIFQMNSWWVYETKIILQYANASTPEVNVVKFCKLSKTSCKIRGVWMINPILKLLATFEKPNLVALKRSFTRSMTEHCTKTLKFRLKKYSPLLRIIHANRSGFNTLIHDLFI